MSDNVTPFVLRLATGIVFLSHGLIKLFVFTVPGTVAFFEQVGFPGWLAVPTMAVEIAGGTLMLAGLFTRFVGLAFLPILAGALMTHWPNGYMFSVANGGWEFPALMLVLVALQIRLGDGAFALNNVNLKRSFA
jgi:putative oxidoreductase